MTSTDVANYPCKDGYLCAEGSTTETGSTLCPFDHYCQAGTQTKCATATYSLIGGLTKPTECIECPPGKYCTANSVDIKDCPSGYFCPGKLDAAPTGSTNQCAIGEYCPGGTAVALKCEPGTYQDTVGQGSCKPCPAGSYCPDSGMSTHTSCTTSFTDWYCPAGSL